MEAELVRVDAGRAILRSSDGNEFAINLSKLSAADQAYLKTSGAGPATVTTPAAPAAPLAPDAKTNTAVGKLFAYREAQALVGGLPESIKLRRPDDAKFILIQYGPEAGEVLYVVFDPPGPQSAADAAYVWSPALTGFQMPRRIAGKSRKMKDANAYVMEIPVSTKFGDLGVKGTLELISGVQNWWLFLVVGNFGIVKGGKSSSFLVSGYMNDFAVDMADAQGAKPLRLLTDIVFVVTSHSGTGLTSSELKMGQHNFLPGMNMKNEIKVVIVDEKGSKADDHGWKINEDHLLSTGPEAIFMYVPEKLKQGGKYVTRATIDLGPIFGLQTSEKTFTMQ